MDLNLQFRDALPPHTVCHLHSAGSGGSSRPQQLYQFAKADDCSDDTAARTVDRPTRTKVSNPLPIWRGTGSSNPSPSSGESAANSVVMYPFAL